MSKFVEVFQKSGGQSLLDADILLVRILPKEEAKTASGILLAESSNQVNGIATTQMIFAEVLRTGNGYYDDEGKHLPLDAAPGNVIAVGQNSAPAMARYGNLTVRGGVQFAYVRASEVIERWESKEAYDAYFKGLSDALGAV